MGKLKKTVKELKPAFTNDLWKMDLNAFSSNAKRRFFRFIKLSRFTVTEFAEKRMGFQCVALSYFGVMAVIPMLAIILYVTQGLGIFDRLSVFMHANFKFSPEMLDMILDKAQVLLDTASSGWVGLVGALTFLWTILWLMFQTERVFNNIWGIRKIPRKLYKRISTYLIMIFIIPFVVIIFTAGIGLYTNAFKSIGLDFREFHFFKTLLSWAIFAVVAIFTISSMYKYIPAVKVDYHLALRAAIPAGLVFTAFQYLYLETQMFIGRLNAVYGVLAAIPLFMTWMNFSWQIIMYGCMLCRAFHSADDYNLDD